ncbi:UDP-glucose 4-epimerase [Trinickia sp. LjRoot230]|uniref:UDP-glucose 4-epimerase n=1 Tax=Trinickia sp. LjRoot230 TaxID=3342288 RepID=UPI003ECCDCFF
MALSGSVSARHWTVTVDTLPVADGFACAIRVAHDSTGAPFEHTFKHFKTFGSEREAILDGLREGMLWVEHNASRTFRLKPSR